MQDAIIPLLLAVCCVLAGIMAIVTNLESHGSAGRSSRRGTGLGAGSSFGHASRSHHGGRGYESVHSLGRGYEYAHTSIRGESWQRSASRPRYYANGSGSGGTSYDDASWNEPPAPPPAPPAPHWSETLGIERTAGHGEIRKAYARVMRGLHPDIVAQDAMTSQRCAEAQAAYEKAKIDAKTCGRP